MKIIYYIVIFFIGLFFWNSYVIDKSQDVNKLVEVPIIREKVPDVMVTPSLVVKPKSVVFNNTFKNITASNYSYNNGFISSMYSDSNLTILVEYHTKIVGNILRLKCNGVTYSSYGNHSNDQGVRVDYFDTTCSPDRRAFLLYKNKNQSVIIPQHQKSWKLNLS